MLKTKKNNLLSASLLIIGLAVVPFATASAESLCTLKNVGSGEACRPSQCELTKPAVCADRGGYAVTNEDGELLSSCDTGRAAIDDLNALVNAGVCSL